ncbi:heme-transporter, endosomal/lysosomal, heme-responsive domain-containing protein [Ditylenchus destructor]|nr:heme-transporter, endosomal/lysosomal, heme-responsive domain-containing protein [Ditylenchus destructor]
MLCSMKIRFIWAALGISAGLTAGTMFAFMYQNWMATSIAFFSSLCATYLYYIHYAYYKSWMFDWSHRKLTLIVVINTVLCLIGLAGCIVAIILAIIRGETITHEGLMGNNLWIVSVWCWMTFKWTMASAIYARQYSRKIAEQSINISQPPSNSSLQEHGISA